MAFDISLSSVTHSRSVLRPRLVASSAPALATTTSADFSLRQSRRAFTHKARSPQVRTHSFITQPPHLRRLTFDQKSFAVFGPLALIGTAFYVVLVHRLMICAPRFLPTIGRPHAVALRFARLGQLAAGLAPAGVRPCWAHQRQTPPKGRSLPWFCQGSAHFCYTLNMRAVLLQPPVNPGLLQVLAPVAGFKYLCSPWHGQ